MSDKNLISFSKSSYTSLINDLVDRALNQLSSASFKVFMTAYRNIFGYGKKVWGWLANTKIEEKGSLSLNTVRRGLIEAEKKNFIKVYKEKINGVTRQYIIFVCEETSQFIDDLDSGKVSFKDLENEKIAYLSSVKLAKTLESDAQKLNDQNANFEGSKRKNAPPKIEPTKHTTSSKKESIKKNNQTEENENDDAFLQKELEELKEKIIALSHPTHGKFKNVKFNFIKSQILDSEDPELKLKVYMTQLDYLPFRAIKFDLESCYFASVSGNWSIPKNYKNTEAEEEKNLQLEKDTEKFTPIIKIWDANHSGLISEKNAFQTMLSKIKMKIDDFNYSKDNLERLDIALDLIEKINKTKNLFGIDLVEKSSKKKELELIFDRYSELVAA